MAEPRFTWAASIPRDAVAALGPVRLIGGLESADNADEVWVRGPELDPADEEAVRQIPWHNRYDILGDGQLRRAERFLPEGNLPSVKWTRLPDFLRGQLSPAAPPGNLPERLAVELRADSDPREPKLLEADAAEWLAWVETAPAIRLERLAFIVDETRADRVVVRGTPLPPLAGLRFVERDGVAVPAGSRWWPDVSAATLLAALRVGKGELALIRPDRTWSRVPRSAWVAATRSAVRLMFNPEAHAR